MDCIAYSFNKQKIKIIRRAEQGSAFFGNKIYNYIEKYNLSYIEIPVMPKVSIGFNNFYLKAFGGPSLNFNLLNKQDKVYEDQDYNQQKGYTNKEIAGLTYLNIFLFLEEDSMFRFLIKAYSCLK